MVGKLRSLEMLRAVAALLVVLYHAQTIFTPRAGFVPLGGVFDAGYRGVDLFFVLSGFIIAYVHGDDIGRPARLANYVFNRFTRIYPAVWIMTALAFGLYAIGFGDADKAAKLAPGAVAASALLLPQHGAPLVNVTWTLTYELFFYALFAILIVNRRIGLVLLLLWQGATLVATLSGAHLGLPGYYLRSLCLDFSIGLACAWWLRRPGGVASPSVWFALLAAGIASFIAGMALNNVVTWSGVPCGLGAGAIILALVRLEQAAALGVPGVLMRLGGASYSIYMVHFSTITLLAAVLARLHVPVTNLLCVGCAVAGVVAGLAFDRFIDRSIQHWFRQRKSVLLRLQPVQRAA